MVIGMKIREIGSDFSLENNIDKINGKSVLEYLGNYNTIYFDSGRSAIKYITSYLKDYKTMYLPNYLCESIIKSIDTRLKKKYYKVNNDFNLDIDYLKKLAPKNSIIFVINYFGKLQDKKVKEIVNKLKEEDNIIIEDTTHSIFTNVNYLGDYCVCSLRKWIGIPDGGVVYSKKMLNNNIIFEENRDFVDIRLKYLSLKSKYLKGNIEDKDQYLYLLNKGEQILNNNSTIYGISKEALDMLSRIDINYIINKRENNYKYLYEKLKSISEIKIGISCENIVPIGIPVFISNRDEIRKYLIDNKVYCAIHWPIPDEIENGLYNKAIEISNSIITIPIDQRYDYDDMDRIYCLLSSI